MKFKGTKPYLWQHSNRRFYVLWEESGNTKRRSLRTDDPDLAQKRFNAFVREFYAGRIGPVDRTPNRTLAEFTEEYLHHMEARTANYDSWKCYRTALRHAKECWGNIQLKEITSRHLDVLVDRLAHSSMKPVTINKNLRHLSAALKKANEWEYMPSIRFPHKLKERTRLKAISPEQLQNIIGRASEIDPEIADHILFAAYTGMRSGEIIRLQWDDVDNPEGFLRIDASQKNAEESRIPINRETRVILDRCREYGHKKVFKIGSVRTANLKLKAVVKDLGLPEWITFHSLRHTFGSVLASIGTGDKIIQRLMRHKSPASTQVYTNPFDDAIFQASDRLNYGIDPEPKKEG